MISFESVESGVAVVDAVERHRYVLETGEALEPMDADPDVFGVPIDRATRVRAASISLPTVAAVYVRDEAGEVVAEVEHCDHEQLPTGTYSLEVCAPIKLYMRVRAGVTISADAERTRIGFGERTEVTVGARSYHERPAATVTTTADPTDLMAAVSTFGSALKTTSPERSYPTLRGHPPTVELGEELSIPTAVEAPDTGVWIEVPPEHDRIFVAAPLAYYLGARLVPGERARIVTEAGFEYSLEGAIGFERRVERVLKQVFLLDCVARTEGIYPVELAERDAVEPWVDIDWKQAYEQPLSERLETYLSVPFEAIEEYIPEWKLTTHVDPVAESIETLPFVVNDLAVVRTPRPATAEGPSEQAAIFDEFVRGSGEADEAAALTRSATTQSTEQPTEAYVQPEQVKSLEQVWIGEGTPLGASKATARAYRNRLDREPTDGPIEIAVVCNDPEMDAERADVDSVYGSRVELPFEVSVHHGLTVAELEGVLTSSVEFVHYIGHIETGGFECADGKLDAEELASVGVEAFFLNGCTSYDQGMALVEAGAIGGVVTVSDVIDSGAVRIGCAMARLLNSGFPLGVALELAREESVVGGQYLVVGDGGLAVAQARNGFPNLCRVEATNGVFQVGVETFPTSSKGLGSMVIPHVQNNGTFSLSSGRSKTFEMSAEELKHYVSLENAPIEIDNELCWPSEIELADLT